MKLQDVLTACAPVLYTYIDNCVVIGGFAIMVSCSLPVYYVPKQKFHLGVRLFLHLGEGGNYEAD